MGHYDDQRERQIESEYFDRLMKERAEEEKYSSSNLKEVVREVLKQLDKEKELENRDFYDFQEPEFWDFLKVLEIGAEKYERDNWLEPDGKRSSHKEMHDSMFHHLAESFAHKEEDDDTGLHPLLHLAARALMVYTRWQRGIQHPEDY